jgi:hypothetical protein
LIFSPYGEEKEGALPAASLATGGGGPAMSDLFKSPLILPFTFTKKPAQRITHRMMNRSHTTLYRFLFGRLPDKTRTGFAAN